MNVDITVMSTTPWDPYAVWGSSYGPWFTEFDAETKYLGSDVPTSYFDGMQVQLFDDSFSSTLPTMLNSCPWAARYYKSSISSNSFLLHTSPGTSNAYNC